eukprot:scaffold78825_cov78-Phaeocystis_antarctica.AAC.1
MKNETPERVSGGSSSSTGSVGSTAAAADPSVSLHDSVTATTPASAPDHSLGRPEGGGDVRLVGHIDSDEWRAAA